MKRAHLLLFLLVMVMAGGAARAAGPIDAFIARAFTQPPAPSALWLTPETKQQAKAAAGFAPDGARLRYWRDGDRTAWVIDRIGKEAPITFGVIVERDAIVAVDVITYRESRGHEIQAQRFLAQFTGAQATARGIDRRVDNITGATLSVRASIDVARLALFCHRQVFAQDRH